MLMDVPSGKTQALRLEDEQSSDLGSDSEPGLEPEPEAGVPCRPYDEFDVTAAQATPARDTDGTRSTAMGEARAGVHVTPV